MSLLIAGSEMGWLQGPGTGKSVVHSFYMSRVGCQLEAILHNPPSQVRA